MLQNEPFLEGTTSPLIHQGFTQAQQASKISPLSSTDPSLAMGNDNYPQQDVTKHTRHSACVPNLWWPPGRNRGSPGPRLRALWYEFPPCWPPVVFNTSLTCWTRKRWAETPALATFAGARWYSWGLGLGMLPDSASVSLPTMTSFLGTLAMA